MKRLYSIIILTLASIAIYAQTHIRIHHKGGGHSDVVVEQIDSITFVDGQDVPDSGGILVGSWLWGNADAGYYELLTFNDDKTFMGYDNYFTYGFDSTTYGWYMHYGSMLSLQSNGFGYNRRYNWFLIGLTDNALDVMTKMGRFIYYKLSPDIIQLEVNGPSVECENGDYYIFTDNVIVGIVDNALQGLSEGTTYIQKYSSSTNTIVSHKVVVTSN